MPEPQPPRQFPNAVQTLAGRVRVGRKDQGRPLEQLREGVPVPGALDARHGVPPHEPEPGVLHHVRQGRTDHTLDTAAVHHGAAPAEPVPVGGDVVLRGLGVQGDDHQVALRQAVRRQGGGEDALVQGPAEHRAVGVAAQKGAVRVLADGLGHAAADEPQAHNANCFDHKNLPTGAYARRRGAGSDFGRFCSQERETPVVKERSA